MPTAVHKHQKNVRSVLLGVTFCALTVALAKAIQMLAPLETTYPQYWLFPLALAALIAGFTVFILSRLSEEKPAVEVSDLHYPLLAAGLGACCMIIMYLFIGMWPTGIETGMIVDMHHQYAPLLNQLRDMILNGGSAFYSFEVGLGTSFLPLFAYYLASPFNVLLVLFPETLLAEGILVITLLKNALTAFLFAFCVQYVYRQKSRWIPLAAISYSLMMYLLAYSWNIMWLDCVMVLPLVIMSFERLMRTGKFLPYILSLGYALYANYYIGFMVCVFLVIYYVAWLLRNKRTGKHAVVSFGRFALGSVLGGGLAMFLLVPVALSLGDTSAAGAALPELATEFDLFSLLRQLILGVEPTIRSGNLPNLYCGLLAVVFVPIFATTSAIPLRRRITWLGVLGVMALSLSLNVVNLFWHGFHAPNDLPHRFSFLFSFVLVIIAYETLLHLESISVKQIGLSVAALGAWLILEERFGETDFKAIYISLAVVLLYGFLLTVAAKQKVGRQAFSALLTFVVVAELTIGGCYSMYRLNCNEYYTDHSNYTDNVTNDALNAMVEKTEEIGDKAANGAFYRMEFIPRRTCVDTALYDYRGITVFASSNSYEATRLMGGLGYAVNGVNSYLYHSFVAPVDSLLGIRYVALENNIQNHAQLKQIDSVTATRKYSDGSTGESTYYIYENTEALPLGYMAYGDITNWSYSYYNPFYSQNTLYQELTGNEEEIYSFLPIEEYGFNANGSIAGVSGFQYEPVNGEEETGTFVASVEESGQYFAYVDCRSAESLSVEIDGGDTYNVTPHEPYIIDLGTLDADDRVFAHVTANKMVSGNIYICRMQTGAYLKHVKQLAEGGLQVSSFTDSSVVGRVTAQKDGVMFITLPYDQGWQVTVDGKPAEVMPLGEGFMGVAVSAGTHTVAMNFVPRGFWLGLWISLASLFVTVLISVLQYSSARKKGKKEMAEEMTSPFLTETLGAASGNINPLPEISLEELLKEVPAEVAEEKNLVEPEEN